MFAFFMDYIVYPVFWVCSPRVRAHASYVKLQNAHLDGHHHSYSVAGCGLCLERSKR